MPLLLVVAVLLLGMVAFMILMVPMGIILRYRVASARRRGRGWVATINFFGASLSAVLLLLSSALSNIWIPHALEYTVAGLCIGALLGFIGLASSHWEETHRGLHYTPNRFLILALTLLVSARIAYGFWRGWHAWHSTPSDQSWLAASGAAGSMGAGATVLGYYVTYWAGLLRELKKRRG